jgi:solute carrier family 35 protein F1/2
MASSEEAEQEGSSSYDPLQHMEIEESAAERSFLGRAIYHVRHNYKTLLFGQLLSLLLASTGAAQATLHLNCDLSAPTFTIGVIYFVLSLHLIVVWKRGRSLVREDESQSNQPLADTEQPNTKDCVMTMTEPQMEIFPFLGLVLHRPAWQYLIFAFLDVQANYCTVLAFRYTTLTSVTLFDALAIPSSMIISKCVFTRHYTWMHLMGVVICMSGVVFNVLQDYESDQTSVSQEYPHKLRGDLLAITGGVLYGLNDVITEASVRRMSDTVEYLGMLGFFASLISIAQALALERQDILEFFGRNPDESSTCSLWMGWAMLFTFVAVSVLSYMGASRFLLLSEAAFFNLSLLTGDMWSVLFSVVAERIVPPPLFFVALVLVLSGVVLYEMAPSPVMEKLDESSTSSAQRLQQEDPDFELQEMVST